MSLNTKFGNCKIQQGYYVISSRKEGNHGKKLHVLLFTEEYGNYLPTGYQIHHIDGDKKNNEEDNLVAIPPNIHTIIHNTKEEKHYGTRKHELESKYGFYGVTKRKRNNINQGYLWRYNVYVNGSKVDINSTSLNELKEKVLRKGYKWLITNEIKAKKSLEEEKLNTKLWRKNKLDIIAINHGFKDFKELVFHENKKNALSLKEVSDKYDLNYSNCTSYMSDNNIKSPKTSKYEKEARKFGFESFLEMLKIEKSNGLSFAGIRRKYNLNKTWGERYLKTLGLKYNDL